MAPVTFYDFKHLPGYPSTFALPLKEGHVLKVVKFDESAEYGYGYAVRLCVTAPNGEVGEEEVIAGYFDGFGMEDRPNDVIHDIRKYLNLTGYRS